MRTANAATETSTYWDIDDIQFHCRVGRTTAWRLVKIPDFPPPVVIGPKGLVWPRHEVIRFMEDRRSHGHYRQRQSDGPSPPSSSPVLYRRRSVRQRRQPR